MSSRRTLGPVVYLLLVLVSCLGEGILDNRQIARQILQERCHGHGASDTDKTLQELGEEAVQGWVELETEFLDTMTTLFHEDANRTLARLLAHIEKLLVQKTPLGFACPVLTAGNIYQAAMVWATSGQHNRARVLLQIGNMFKLQSISQWWGYTESLKAKGLPPASKRFETAMQADYSISLAALAHKLNVPPLSKVKAASEARRRNIEIHSICSYADDPTSNTGLTSELPEMAPRNHQSYADHFGYRYVLHSDLAEGRENMEAHYSKMMVVLRALETSPTIEWLMFIDCDAFFTDFTTSLDALVDTFAPEGSGDRNPVGISALLNWLKFLFPARELL
ncbi:hypothetical protein FOZ62_019111 [Perkinsus olseni]|uniref:Uncharacterized protein n=1 Tax=Perkinsus olseni TaxID=32597 RepID=A0A7J6SLM3_PEROL|nr:hypothetical protein FOZ62_019111 [Perkinsus olseni]